MKIDVKQNDAANIYADIYAYLRCERFCERAIAKNSALSSIGFNYYF